MRNKERIIYQIPPEIKNPSERDIKFLYQVVKNGDNVKPLNGNSPCPHCGSTEVRKEPANNCKELGANYGLAYCANCNYFLGVVWE